MILQEILGDETVVGGTIHLKVLSKKKALCGRGTELWLVGTLCNQSSFSTFFPQWLAVPFQDYIPQILTTSIASTESLWRGRPVSALFPFI